MAGGTHFRAELRVLRITDGRIDTVADVRLGNDANYTDEHIDTPRFAGNHQYVLTWWTPVAVGNTNLSRVLLDCHIDTLTCGHTSRQLDSAVAVERVSRP